MSNAISEIMTEAQQNGKLNEFEIVGKSILRAWDRAVEWSNGNEIDFGHKFYTELEEERRLMEKLGIAKEIFWYQFGIMVNTLEMSPSQRRKCERNTKRELRCIKRKLCAQTPQDATGTRPAVGTGNEPTAKRGRATGQARRQGHALTKPHHARQRADASLLAGSKPRHRRPHRTRQERAQPSGRATSQPRSADAPQGK